MSSRHAPGCLLSVEKGALRHERQELGLAARPGVDHQTRGPGGPFWEGNDHQAAQVPPRRAARPSGRPPVSYHLEGQGTSPQHVPFQALGPGGGTGI